MELLKRHSDKDLQKSILAELAKAKSELNCAQGDLNKIHSRLSFLLALQNELIKREKD